MEPFSPLRRVRERSPFDALAGARLLRAGSPGAVKARTFEMTPGWKVYLRLTWHGCGIGGHGFGGVADLLP